MDNTDQTQRSIAGWLISSKWVLDSNIPVGVRVIGLLAFGLGLFLILTFFVFLVSYIAIGAWSLLLQALYHAGLGGLLLIGLPFFLIGRPAGLNSYIGGFAALGLYLLFDWPLMAGFLFVLGVISALYLLTSSSVNRYFTPASADYLKLKNETTEKN